MIKAVIFDMDGLLIDSEPHWRQTNEAIYKRLGINVKEADHTFMRGSTVMENLQYYYDRQPWESMTLKEAEQLVIQNMVNLVKAGINLKPGVDHAIKVCKKAGLPIAIASGSPLVLIDAVVDSLKIREHFDHIHSAQFEEYGKPHPGVFLSVAKEFGVSPASCLVFEDSAGGVLAAKAARMKCIAVPELDHRDSPYIKTADLILGSLEEFTPKLLDKL